MINRDEHCIWCTHRHRATIDGSADDFVRGTKAEMLATVQRWKAEELSNDDVTYEVVPMARVGATLDWVLHELRHGRSIRRLSWPAGQVLERAYMNRLEPGDILATDWVVV